MPALLGISPHPLQEWEDGKPPRSHALPRTPIAAIESSRLPQEDWLSAQCATLLLRTTSFGRDEFEGRRFLSKQAAIAMGEHSHHWLTLKKLYMGSAANERVQVLLRDDKVDIQAADSIWAHRPPNML